MSNNHEIERRTRAVERVAKALNAARLAWEDLRGALALEPDDAIVVAGSQVLPMGVQSDDLDLLIVQACDDLGRWESRRDRERLGEQRATGYAIVPVHVNGVELDCEIWPRSTVNAAIAALPRGAPTAAQVQQDFSRFAGLDRKVGLDLLHALALGIEEPRSTATVVALRREVDWNAYALWNRTYHLINVGDAVKGVKRSLNDGRNDEAYVKACWAADNVLDAAIFDAGLSISRWKWRLRYMPFLDPSICEWYQAVHFGGLPQRAEVIEAWVDLLREVAGGIGRPLGRPFCIGG